MRAARLTRSPTTTRSPSPRPRGPDHHLAGVDADPHRQLDAEAVLEAAVELFERTPHGEGGAHRPVRVVLVGPPQTEDGHHRVTDVLLDDATLGLDGDAPGGEVVVHDLAHVLGVEPAREHGEVDDICEQDRDQLPLLGRREGPQPVPLLHQRLEGGVDHGIPERDTLAPSLRATMARSTAVNSSTFASPGPKSARQSSQSTAPTGWPAMPGQVSGNGLCAHQGSDDGETSVTHFTHQNPRRPGATSRAGNP